MNELIIIGLGYFLIINRCKPHKQGK